MPTLGAEPMQAAELHAEAVGEQRLLPYAVVVLPPTHPAAEPAAHARLLSQLDAALPLPRPDQQAAMALLEVQAAVTSRLLFQVLSAATDQLRANHDSTAGSQSLVSAAVAAVAEQAPVNAAVTAPAAGSVLLPVAAATEPLWVWLLISASFGLGLLLFAVAEIIHRRMLAGAEAAASDQFLIVAAEDDKENASISPAAQADVWTPAAVSAAAVSSLAATEHWAQRPADVRPLRDELPPSPEGSMPGSPVFSTAMACMLPPVDESVRRRDMTARGWAPVPSREAERTFSNPLFSPTAAGSGAGRGTVPCETLPEAGGAEAELSCGQPQALPGTPKMVQRNESEASASSQASGDFRLGAAIIRTPTIDRLAVLLQRHQQTAAGPAPRKLTGAQSIGPNSHLVAHLDVVAMVEAQGPARRSSTAGSGSSAASLPSRSSNGSPAVAASSAPAVQEMRRQVSAASLPALPATTRVNQVPQLEAQQWLCPVLPLVVKAPEQQQLAELQSVQQQQAGVEVLERQQQSEQRLQHTERWRQQLAEPWRAMRPEVIEELSGKQFQAEVVLGRVLGTGGTGTVYEATWHGRRVAAKVLHPSVQADLRYALAFRR